MNYILAHSCIYKYLYTSWCFVTVDELKRLLQHPRSSIAPNIWLNRWSFGDQTYLKQINLDAWCIPYLSANQFQLGPNYRSLHRFTACFVWNSLLKPSNQPPADNHFHLQERRAAARLPGYFAPLEAAVKLILNDWIGWICAICVSRDWLLLLVWFRLMSRLTEKRFH